MAVPQSVVKANVTRLEGWIRSCNENHGDKCQVDPVVGRPTHHIPDWVIDTEDGCIVRGCSVQRYVALSYVWNPAAEGPFGSIPGTDDRLILKKDDLANFRCRGFLHSHVLERVPVVIRDAIDFVQASGYRYLWVDSLCIVQHEDTTRDRVGLMNEIYSGAYFTIIAATSTEGLYGNNAYDDERLPHESISARHLHSNLICSHWASRGWTFQEQLLSKRSIIFLDNVCFWDCEQEVQWPGSSVNETLDSSVGTGRLPQPEQPAASSSIPVDGASLESVRCDVSSERNFLDLTHQPSVQIDALFQIQQPPSRSRHPLEKAALESFHLGAPSLGREESQDSASLSRVPDLKSYIELVCRYNNRNLTYDQDVLPAFSGVLEVLSRRSFRGGFISGLPALFLDDALLWQPLLKARRRRPAGTATKIAPMAPLPSWSWAGWQCLVDPDSLRGSPYHIDQSFAFYRRDSLRTEKTSWETRKLVDWSILSHDGSVKPIDEPGLLQSFKAGSEEPNQKSLPPAWSRNDTGAFFHTSNPTVGYRYPVPTQDTFTPAVAESNTSLLFCRTNIATLRVRRVLVSYELGMENQLYGSMQSLTHASVAETDLYNFKPRPYAFCPVITVEDNKGRWAGAMAAMQDEFSLKPGSKLQFIAISTGSALQQDVAECYPEMIDSQSLWRYGPSLEDYHFRPRDWSAFIDWSRTREHSAADHTRQRIAAGVDVGPFAYRHFPGTSNPSLATHTTEPAASDQPERYHFYNVLWVETIDGVMYRKAAGRISKEIWELNCGGPTEIVLG